MRRTRIDPVARRGVVEQRLLDPAVEEHRVDQRVQELPAPAEMLEDELPAGVDEVGDRRGEAR
jgi:hypothetical protein